MPHQHRMHCTQVRNTTEFTASFQRTSKQHKRYSELHQQKSSCSGVPAPCCLALVGLCRPSASAALASMSASWIRAASRNFRLSSKEPTKDGRK
jgi:hypothetical protein